MTIILDYDNDAIRIESEKGSNITTFRQVDEKTLNFIKRVLDETFNQIAAEHDCAVCASMNLAQQNEGYISNIDVW